MRRSSLIRQSAFLAFLIAALLFACKALAQTYVPSTDTVLHVFQGGSADGILPVGGVVFDSVGNLYGATTYGGSGGTDCIGGSCGTVYQLTPPAKQGGAWVESILYNFTGLTNNQDGELPNGGLVIDRKGNLYGVTAYGGSGGCILLGGLAGCGTVFQLTPPAAPGGAWTKTTIYSFRGGSDGYLPNGSLTFDQAGNLYGATNYGGGFGSCNAPFYQYCGTIFELSPPKTQGGSWTEKVLYSFKSDTDGANPFGGLVFDKHGAIYGTTWVGGNQICLPAGGVGCGTVFKLQPVGPRPGAWTELVLYRFQNIPDGAIPTPGLVVDEKGDLYGTTLNGGINQEGVVFRLSPPAKPGAAWVETLILNFGGLLGGQPMAGLALGNGSLYGTASNGGAYEAGTAFRLGPLDDPTNSPTYAALSDFPTGKQAIQPEAQLSFDDTGTLYGTTVGFDLHLCGTVFQIRR